MSGAHGGQKVAVGPLELELLKVVNYHVGAGFSAEQPALLATEQLSSPGFEVLLHSKRVTLN